MSQIPILIDDLRNPKLNYDIRTFKFGIDSSDLNKCETIPSRIKQSLMLSTHNLREWPSSMESTKIIKEQSHVNYGVHEFELKLDITGYSQEEVLLEILQNHLIIRASHNIDNNLNKYKSYFKKSYHIPEIYDTMNMKATFSEHILEITIPVITDNETTSKT